MKISSTKIRSQYNLFRVLRFIWLNHGISRIELCRMLEMDKATMSTIVAHLISLGIVEEVKPKTVEVKPGRKPIGLDICRGFGYVLGFEYHINGLKAVVKDMHSQTVAEYEFPHKIQGDQIKTSFFSALEEIRKEMEGKSILGVGVSIPGTVDHDRGVITHSRRLGIENNPYDFRSEVFDHLDIPGFIDNDANCCARGVMTDYRTEEYRNFLYTLFDYESKLDMKSSADRLGLGLGIGIDGKLYYGPDCTAGEFQTIINDQSKYSQLNLNREEQDRYDVDSDVQRKLFMELSTHLALFVNVFNFQHIFIGGDYPSLLPDLEEILMDAINKNWMYHNKQTCKIHIQQKDEMSPSLGAAGMFLEQLFTVPDMEHDRGALIWQRIFRNIDLLNY